MYCCSYDCGEESARISSAVSPVYLLMSETSIPSAVLDGVEDPLFGILDFRERLGQFRQFDGDIMDAVRRVFRSGALS